MQGRCWPWLFKRQRLGAHLFTWTPPSLAETKTFRQDGHGLRRFGRSGHHASPIAGVVLVAVAVFLIVPIAMRAKTQISRAWKTWCHDELMVDGKPFLMLAGELHNSSSSSLE